MPDAEHSQEVTGSLGTRDWASQTCREGSTLPLPVWKGNLSASVNPVAYPNEAGSFSVSVSLGVLARSQEGTSTNLVSLGAF